MASRRGRHRQLVHDQTLQARQKKALASGKSQERKHLDAVWASSQQVPSIDENCDNRREFVAANWRPMRKLPSKTGRNIRQSCSLAVVCKLLVSVQLILGGQLVCGQQTFPPLEEDPNSNQPLPSASSTSSSSSSSSSSSTTASCFGGIQTFEKISMSTFENPSGQSANAGSAGSFGSGILVQQDDQALTSECVNLCRSQSNCLSFVIDYNKFECKSYATTQQELKQEFDAKYQQHTARSINNASSSLNQTTTVEGIQNGYLMSASSNVNSQHLLPSASSNYFEKTCLDGIANRNQFNDACGQGRLWTIERVVDSFLDGYVEKEVTNVNHKDECSKLCIFESQFVCRSADYDQQARLCRLSKEDRRTQPQAMRYAAGSNRQYLENQCATPGPSSCVYETKKNVGIISMDALKFAQTVQDCQMKCNQESTFNCRSYSFHQQRCFLSGDDSASLSSNLIKLPSKQGWQFGEKRCLIELCTKGVFSYEKITGYTLRSALSSPIDLLMQSGSTLGLSVVGNNLDDLDRLQHESSQTRLSQLLPIFHPRTASNLSSSAANMVSTMMMVAANRDDLTDPMHESASSSAGRRQRATGSSSNNLAIMNHCRHSCDLGYLNCPAFTIDYKNNRCQRLDRNSQGRHHELVARDGFSYYEKICLRVPEIMSMCQDKYWIFERVLGYELAPRLYEKTIKFVQSRRDCQEYCLEEKQFQCRSALYNDESSDCKLSRYDRRLAQQEGAYNRNFNPRISYLENQCVRDHGSERKCSYELARDEPALPTFTEHIEMVPSGQSETDQSLGGHRGSAPLMMANSSATTRYGVSHCEQLCNDNAKFECHSFGYYPSVAQCFLSGDDTVSAGESASTYRTGFSYYEKKCRLVPKSSNQSSTSDDSHASTPSSDTDLNPYFQPATRRPPASTTTATDGGPSTTSMGSIEQPGTDEDAMLHGGTPTRGPPHSFGGGPTQGGQDQRPAANDANQYKCGLGHTFVYQRIPGFEPIGGYLTLLLKNNNQPGIVTECAELCKSAFECRAFVVDYASNQCFAMLENSSVGLLSLRQIIGKDYFEGFCVADHTIANSGGGKSCSNHTWLMDKIVDQAVVGVQPSRVVANSDRVQCRLACLEERLFWCKSAMFESSTRDCKLYSIDRESMAQMRLVFTKGVDFYENQCQISSNSCPYDAIERDMTIITVTKSIQAKSTFDCEHGCNSETSFNCRSYTYLDKYPSLPNLCLLSSDSRSTSQKGSTRAHPRTLYAERNCYFRRPRIPGNADHRDQLAGPGGDPYLAGPAGDGVSRAPEHQAAHGHEHTTTGLAPSGELPTNDPLGAQACKSHQFTFERTFGYDFRLAQKERAPIAPTIGIAIACQQECLRRADRCQSFVVEYKLPYQSCFLMDTQVGANKKLLVRSPHSAYFEKVCLPRPGLVDHEALPPTSGAQYSAMDAPQDMAPGYSHEPWSPQAPPPNAQHLPYYLQQQQLVDTYPSRACAKLWSFERFVNHNFTAPADKSIGENVFTRAQCEGHCLNEASFSCRAATYDYNNKLCRLFKNTRRTVMSQFVDLESPSANSTAATDDANAGQTQVGRQLVSATAELPNFAETNIDYMENTCAPEPSSCQYRQLYDLFSPYIERMQHAVSLSDCQRQCDLERLFGCKSINYDPATRKCMLINEDFISLSRGQQQPQQGLMPRKNSIYSEKGNCELISVQCNSQEMLVSINFDSPFRGRVMAKGNPEQCFMIGDGQTVLQFPIVFGPKCNSRQEGVGNFVNEILIQQHPVIMTDSDKTVRVMCAFEAPEQTITLKNPSSRDQNRTGIDVVGNPAESSRTRHDKQHQQFNSVVSNKAPPPSVMLRILDQSGRDASMINLGDDLVLKIQMPTDNNGQNSALGIFARNLVARSSNGESLMLIDNEGCPVDHQRVFPALEVDPKDGRSLYSTFRAFRFPSSGLVNFEVQIRFCPERCQPVECQPRNSANRLQSLGRRRRKRRQAEDFSPTDDNNSNSRRAPILQSVNPAIELPGTLMKPGKAFQFVRELLSLAPPKQLADSESTRMDDNNPGESIELQGSTSGATKPSEDPNGDGFDNPRADLTTNGYDNGAAPISEAPAVDSMASSSGDVAGQPKLERPFEKNILMHVDERLIPPAPMNTLTSAAGLGQLDVWPTVAKSQQAPPYGRFPFPNHLDGQQQDQANNRRQVATNTGPPPLGDQAFRPGGVIVDDSADRIESLEAMSNRGADNQALQDSVDSNLSTATTGLQVTSAQDHHQSTTAGGSNSSNAGEAKDMPLRFSILVGEGGQASTGAANSGGPVGGGWSPGSSNPVLVMNSSSLDVDHIVIPGKDGQLDGQRQPETTGDHSSATTNGITESSISSSSSSHSETPYGMASDMNKITSGSKRAASYEQTFDAQPLLDSFGPKLTIEDALGGDQLRQSTNAIKLRTEGHSPEVAAASRDCQIDSGQRRLWTIIWTGAFVIALNVCLVIVSLVLYFKKVHLRQNHSIVHTATSPSLDGTTNHSSSHRRRRWPSVLLKSKNDLGTSLNAHEHFFCKLNSQPVGSSSANLQHDFNWPNLSSSSSHSTISSMASPLPISSVRIHHQQASRPTYKYPFDSQASIRNNFNPGFRCTLDEDGYLDTGNPSGNSNNAYSNTISTHNMTEDDESHLGQTTR